MKISIRQLRRLISESTEFPAWEDMSRKEQIASEYSDAYKERYGIRPHHLSMDDWNAMTDEEAEEELRDLYKQPGMHDDYDYMGDDNDGEYSQEYMDYYFPEPIEGTVSPEENEPEPGENLPTRVPFKGGGEHDAFGKGKKYHSWKAGQRKAHKRRYNKRLRQVR